VRDAGIKSPAGKRPETPVTGPVMPLMRPGLPYRRGCAGAEPAAAVRHRGTDDGTAQRRGTDSRRGGADGGTGVPVRGEDAVESGPGRRARAPADRCEHEQRHRGDGGPRQQREHRAQRDDRDDGTRRGPQPVKPEREQQAGQRQGGPETPAGLLPEPAERRLALAAGQPGQQVHRDPALVAASTGVQARQVAQAAGKVQIANADHGTVRSRTPNPARFITIGTGPPVAALAAPNITQRIAMFTVNSEVAGFAPGPHPVYAA
jgi:hypothetical protein